MKNSDILQAMEACWTAIQTHHPEVPDVRLVLGTGMDRGVYRKRGHWWPSQWSEDAKLVPEVMVAAEHLQQGQDAVLATLLHEAAHGLAWVRGIKDVSRGGRWHNRRFAEIARALGCIVEKDRQYGHRTTGLTTDTLILYGIVAYRLGVAMDRVHRIVPNRTKTKKKPGPKSLICGCRRRIRMRPNAMLAGPVVCGICLTIFQDPEEEYDVAM